MPGDWRSKGPSDGQSPNTAFTVREGTQCAGTAHYIVDGAPVCAKLKMKDGVTPVLAPFKCSWVELRWRDRKCGYCRRLEP